MFRPAGSRTRCLPRRYCENSLTYINDFGIKEGMPKMIIKNLFLRLKSIHEVFSPKGERVLSARGDFMGALLFWRC